MKTGVITAHYFFTILWYLPSPTFRMNLFHMFQNSDVCWKCILNSKNSYLSFCRNTFEPKFPIDEYWKQRIGSHIPLEFNKIKYFWVYVFPKPTFISLSNCQIKTIIFSWNIYLYICTIKIFDTHYNLSSFIYQKLPISTSKKSSWGLYCSVSCTKK